MPENLNRSTSSPFRLPLKNAFFARLIERALGLAALDKYYQATPTLALNKEGNVSSAFLEYTLNAVGVKTQILNEANLTHIPNQGAIIFVANHPLGGLEGVGMSRELQKYRPDLRVLTNLQLTSIPELSDIFIGVDVLSPNAQKQNAKGVRAACKHLGKGGALLIYPAGEVSAIDKTDWTIKDKQWASLVGKLALKYKTACMPFFVEGKNSRLFYTLGLIHERLRTFMLAHELANKRGQTLRFKAGEYISPEEILALNNEQQITEYLREKTDQLAKKTS